MPGNNGGNKSPDFSTTFIGKTPEYGVRLQAGWLTAVKLVEEQAPWKHWYAIHWVRNPCLPFCYNRDSWDVLHGHKLNN